MVNIKLFFYELFYYDLIILKNSIQNLNKALLLPRNQVFWLKNWKIWLTPTNIELNIFYWNFVHISYLSRSTKACSRIFLFCLDLGLFAKIKNSDFYTLICYIFINNSRSKQNQKKKKQTFFCRHF